MKRSLITFILIIIGTIAIAGDKNRSPESTKVVSGKVVDKISGEEIAGAEIRLSNDVVVYSDLNGNFSACITSDKSDAKVSFISYTDTNVTLDPFSYTPLIIELESH
ncbi:MAG: carboxypeptidase-like regulatory domain-containing protein [Bacteroidota bacterium]|nr:carboxypeptidase-like regulatory domain-containing protein [Bacteroidota bacterium]